MKKILTALMLCLVSICFVGCSDYNAPTSMCNVTITASGEAFGQPDVIIKDSRGNQKGMGQLWGDYYVPYDGNISFTWEWSTREGIYKLHCSVPVGSANSLDVQVIGDDYNNSYCRVYVGGVGYQYDKH